MGDFKERLKKNTGPSKNCASDAIPCKDEDEGAPEEIIGRVLALDLPPMYGDSGRVSLSKGEHYFSVLNTCRSEHWWRFGEY
jgi:hypothetical protein